MSGVGGDGHTFHFGGPWSLILNVNIPEIFIPICKTHNTGPSFELIFLKFTQLVRVHLRVNSIVFGNNRPNRTTDKGENVLPRKVFRLSSSPYSFFLFFFFFLNLKTLIGTSFPTEKVMFIFVVRRPLTLKKWSNVLPKQFFAFLRKYYCFRKIVFNMQIFSI